MSKNYGFHSELSIARLVEGESNKEIAHHLEISDNRVKQLINSIGSKLSAFNRVQIAVTAVVKGMVRPRFNDLSEYYSTNAPHSHPQPHTLNQSISARFEAEYSLPPPPPWDTLTEREMMVFRLFAEDMEQTNIVFAEHLEISRDTIRKHLRCIYEKTGCKDKDRRERLSDLAKREKGMRQSPPQKT